MAVQDLHDGECAMVERLGQVQDHVADAGMQDIVEDDAQRSARQRDALAQIAHESGAQTGDTTNIWLRAILDDADNDADTIARGPLRDIALAGALRKGKQSQRVSYETAIALARKLDLGEAADTLDGMAQATQSTDTALAERMRQLAAGL